MRICTIVFKLLNYLLLYSVAHTLTAFTKQLATEQKWDAIVIGSGIGG